MESIVKVSSNLYDICEEYFDCFIRTIYNPITKEYTVEWSKDTPFIQIQGSKVYSGCFVQVLRNSITGEESVGWMKPND